ncbi:uncharacterized protein DUF4275 [Anaerobacterium chartisolvens]|uniref:Uncharacterized protein DUF4275 n=1 Tax=Anaerobacterium chartisolvens TaxID=1297424 RepID=A0A369B4E8_9FIRM|nr:DUF4275 family protein [Anaerobacterium chartisolvens]RCX16353.1 uncharacterized protein DUF4275 [Anaerobacterium chartisolvens]
MEYCRWCDDMTSEEEWEDIIENHSINYKSYYNEEYQRISLLDEADKEVQLRQLVRVMKEMNILEEMEKQRNKNEIKKQLKSEGVVCKECQYTSGELKKKWEQKFLSHMTEKQKEECYLDEYLWNAFTRGSMKDYLEGDDAKKAFDDEEKDKVYIFWQLEEQVYYLATNNKLSSKHLRLEMGRDIYIVDSDFTWTFLYKHCDKRPIWYKINRQGIHN